MKDFLKEKGFTSVDIAQIENLILVYETSLVSLPTDDRREFINRVFLDDDGFSVRLYNTYMNTKRYHDQMEKVLIAHAKYI